MATKYTAEDHKRAFEIYYESRNLTKVSRDLKIAIMTVNRWRDHDFGCAWNCQYHGWDNLILAKNRAVSARNELMEAGVYDPVKIEEAMRQQVKESNQKKELRPDLGLPAEYPAMELIRRNDAVIGDLEYLYRKAYYMATGVALSPDDVAFEGQGLEYEARVAAQAAQYEKGLKSKTFDDAVNTLLKLRNEIVARSGSDGVKVSLEEVTTTKRVSMSLEQLTELREQLVSARQKTNRGAPIIEIENEREEATSTD